MQSNKVIFVEQTVVMYLLDETGLLTLSCMEGGRGGPVDFFQLTKTSKLFATDTPMKKKYHLSVHFG